MPHQPLVSLNLRESRSSVPHRAELQEKSQKVAQDHGGSGREVVHERDILEKSALIETLMANMEEETITEIATGGFGKLCAVRPEFMPSYVGPDKGVVTMRNNVKK